MHLNFKYWQKLKLCQSKVCNILKNSGLSIKKLRNLRFFRFGSLSVAYHAHKGQGFGFLDFCFGCLWVLGFAFLAAKKNFRKFAKNS